MNLTELDIIVAELMFPILVEIAPTGKKVGYKELADLIKAMNPHVPEIANITQRHIGRKLGVIWEFTKSQGCPHIGWLVVLQSGECGTGISTVIQDLPEERKKVKECDWSKVSLDFENYISKVKFSKKERDEKLIKLSREEAKDRFIQYWQEIKDETPISREDAYELKEPGLQLVQEGYKPEVAFSQELLKFALKRQPKNPESSYVYIGQYVEYDTNAPIFDQLKIGYTTDIDSRAQALSGGVDGPLRFDVKYYWEFERYVAYAIEQRLHGRFSSYRKRGEFFENIDGLLAELVDDEITQNYEQYLKSSNYE